MYKTIVVGTDGSATADRAVEVAANLARQWGAALHLVTAYRSSEPGMGAAAGAPMVDAGQQEVRRDAADSIGERAKASWGNGIETKPHAVAGHAADAILDVANEVGADVIVVGSKGMRGARRVLGSVPNSVAHGANCSVLVVKTD